MTQSLFAIAFSLAACSALAADAAPAAPDLKPLLARPDQVVLQDDFSQAGPVNKKQWGTRQGTQWTVEEGVLRGRPSPASFREGKKDHLGYEPRISAPVTPPQFIAKFSVRFSGGAETAISPFVEFGHHVCRLRFSQAGAEILVDGESVKVAESKDLKYEPGKWYHMLAELKGEEFVIQIAGGPTLYASHPAIASPVASGANGLGVAGPREGLVELDNVSLWSILPDAQPTWASARAALPKFEAVPVAGKKSKARGKAKSKAD